MSRELTTMENFLRPSSVHLNPEFWKTVAKLAAAGAVISGSYYFVRYLNSKRPGWYRLSKKKTRLPPPPMGALKSKLSEEDASTNGPVHVDKYNAVVVKLTVYPIKSCKGILVETIHCGEMGPELHTPFGIVRDRTWMVVNAEYHFLTQRRIPRMALICPEIDGAFLLVTAPDMAPLRVPIQPDLSTAKVVQSAVWSQEISGIDCGDEAGEWFSKFLEEPGLRLIYHPPEFAGRQLVERDAKVLKIKRKMWEDKDKCAFADAAPYQLLSEDSVAELSRHMDTPVPYLHFRPSILVNGCPPNNEDHWWRFRIGTSEFRATKQRCRCTLTTVDPQTGTFGRKDVLETLKKFRSNQSAEWDEVYKFGPLLAVDLGIDKTGTCSVGDIIVHLPDE